MRDLLLELGRRYAFIGSQVPLTVGNDTFYLDLLFYNARLNCNFAVELKVGKFKPEYAGKLNSTCLRLDDLCRTEPDAPTIGLLLCESHNSAVVEYALRDVAKPIGVSTFRVTRDFPAPVRSERPTVKALRGVIAKLKDDLDRLRTERGKMSETALALLPIQPESVPAYGRFEELRRAVLNGVTAENSKRNYALALDELSAFCRERQRPVSRTLILEFRAAMLDRNLRASTINVKLAAVRKLVGEAKRAGVITAEESSQMEDVPNVRQNGVRLGNWLTKEQARELLAVPDRSTLKGKRDYVILSLLTGCALRRNELASRSPITFAAGDLEQIKFLLGHSSIQTTERYLGSEQEIAVAVNDSLGL